MMRLFVATVLLFGMSATGSVPAEAEGTPPMQFGAEASSIELSYDAGLLNGRGLSVQLSAVLVKLGQVSGLKLEQRYVPSVDDKVSFRFKDEPVRDAVNGLLSGYDYFIIGSGEPGAALKLMLLGPATFPSMNEEQVPASVAVAPESVQGAVEAMGDKPPAFRGLQDYWRLTPMDLGDSDFDREDMPDLPPSAEELAAIESLRLQERLDRIDRAEEVLASDYRNLHEEALVDLQGIDDPQATAMLRAASVGETGSGNDNLKERAAESLWRHAADLEFEDKQANQALVELAASDDDSVRQIAKQALQDMNYYHRRRQEDEHAAGY